MRCSIVGGASQRRPVVATVNDKRSALEWTTTELIEFLNSDEDTSGDGI